MVQKKVKEFIRRNRLFNTGEKVVVAVSGGPDSLCLLHLLHKMIPELDLSLVVAHLNHCLRPEAELEAEAVQKIAEHWALPFEVKAVDIGSLRLKKKISEEEAGRIARYTFLADVARKHGATSIALGHHRDDQAETVLLNIIRGTGVDGLAGILPKRSRNGLRLVRPLLCLTRAEIEAYCLDHNLQPATDSSNLETDYTRNKLRLELIPQLEGQYNPRIKEALSGLSELAARDRSFLLMLSRKILSRAVRFEREQILFIRRVLLSLPPALQSRILRLALKKYGASSQIGRRHIEKILELAAGDRTGRQLNLPDGLRAYFDYDHILVTGAAEYALKRPVSKILRVPGKTILSGGTAITARILKPGELSWPPSRSRAYLDYESVPPGELTVRFRWPGARFFAQGAPGKKKLKDFFIDQKIPHSRRDRLPLVTVGEDIIWVAGVRIAHPYRVTDQTKKVLVLEHRVLRRPRLTQSRSNCTKVVTKWKKKSLK